MVENNPSENCWNHHQNEKYSTRKIATNSCFYHANLLETGVFPQFQYSISMYQCFPHSNLTHFGVNPFFKHNHVGDEEFTTRCRKLCRRHQWLHPRPPENDCVAPGVRFLGHRDWGTTRGRGAQPPSWFGFPTLVAIGQDDNLRCKDHEKDRLKKQAWLGTEIGMASKDFKSESIHGLTVI